MAESEMTKAPLSAAGGVVALKSCVSCLALTTQDFCLKTGRGLGNGLRRFCWLLSSRWLRFVEEIRDFVGDNDPVLCLRSAAVGQIKRSHGVQRKFQNGFCGGRSAACRRGRFDPGTNLLPRKP